MARYIVQIEGYIMSQGTDGGFTPGLDNCPPSPDDSSLSDDKISELTLSAQRMVAKFVGRFPFLREKFDDLLSDVSFALVAGKWHFKPELGTEYSYLYGLVNNLGKKMIERVSKASTVELLSPANEPIMVQANTIRPIPLEKMLSLFRTQLEDPIDLIIFDNVIVGKTNPKTLAENHHWTVAFIYQRKHRVLLRLRNLFDGRCDEFFERD